MINVGINPDDSGKLCGDIDYETCRKVVEWITPVPGGVGPMTITMLLTNTLAAVERNLRYYDFCIKSHRNEIKIQLNKLFMHISTIFNYLIMNVDN